MTDQWSAHIRGKFLNEIHYYDFAFMQTVVALRVTLFYPVSLFLQACEFDPKLVFSNGGSQRAGYCSRAGQDGEESFG